MTWQPIATAPRDGARILVAEADGFPHVVSWCKDRGPAGQWESDEHAFAGQLHPLWWMPVPPLPAPRGERIADVLPAATRALFLRALRGDWLEAVAIEAPDAALDELDVVLEAFFLELREYQSSDAGACVDAALRALRAARHPEPITDADQALAIRRDSRVMVLRTIADRIAMTPTGKVAALLDALWPSIETLATAHDAATAPTK